MANGWHYFHQLLEGRNNSIRAVFDVIRLSLQKMTAFSTSVMDENWNNHPMRLIMTELIGKDFFSCYVNMNVSKESPIICYAAFPPRYLFYCEFHIDKLFHNEKKLLVDRVSPIIPLRII